jgi:hypothetical protein
VTRSRKSFLVGVAAVAAVDSAWGCSRRGESLSTSSGSPSPSPANSRDLADFIALSALLTGFGGLDATAGNTYLANIRADAARSSALDALVARSGIASASPPATVADLRRRGVFSEPGTLATASQILANWFSGTFAGPNGPGTATWSGALAWRACRFTKPPATCGGTMGYWAKPPA